jgi:hypothetical protein
MSPFNVLHFLITRVHYAQATQVTSASLVSIKLRLTNDTHNPQFTAYVYLPVFRVLSTIYACRFDSTDVFIPAAIAAH